MRRRPSTCLLKIASDSVLGVGAFVLLQLAPQRAEACGLPASPTLTVRVASTSIPADGVLAGVLQLGASACSCGTEKVRVLDAAGAVVPGSVEAASPVLNAWFIFRPTKPWIAGAQYTVAVYNNDDAQPPVTAFTATAPSNAEMSVAATLTTVERGGTNVRCVEYDFSQRAGGCSWPSFYASRISEAMLALALAEPSASQHAYRIVWSADGKRIDSEAQPGLWFAHTFAGAPREVCYEVFASPLGATWSERSVGAGCRRTPPDTLGERSEVFGDVTDTLAACSVPPEGFREQWCRLWMDRGPCEVRGPTPPAACARARAECSNGDAGLSGSGETPEDAATASDESSPRAEQPVTDSVATDDEARDGESGCSVRGPAPNGARGDALRVLVAALSLGLVCRRRCRGDHALD